MTYPAISISIVSHGQADLIGPLLADLAKLPQPERFEVLLTRNLPESLPFASGDFPFSLTLIDNPTPKGFGANHNAAFAVARGRFFAVVNPDIRLLGDPFPALLNGLQAERAAIAGPLVQARDGGVEDSIRLFPTPLGLAAKALGWSDGRYALKAGVAPQSVDWLAGMFMLARSEAFRDAGGFDEGFFLYYEDVDLCARMWKRGWRILACPQARVIHDARRESHRNPRYLRWHLASLLRYLGKHWLRLPKSA